MPLTPGEAQHLLFALGADVGGSVLEWHAEADLERSGLDPLLTGLERVTRPGSAPERRRAPDRRRAARAAGRVDVLTRRSGPLRP
jgi:hypothetical protein